MSTNNESFENRPSQIPSRWPAREHMFWYAATLLALVANLILFVSIHQMGTRVAEQKDATASQISKLGDLITQNSEENSQRMASVAQEARESVMTTQEQAKADLRRTNASLAARIADETKTQQQAQQQVAGQLDELKQASSTASSKIEQISGDITGVKGDVSSAQSVLDQHGNEL